MATKNDKFHIHPGYAVGHDWEEFLEALEKAGLEKHESAFGWSQILSPRTTRYKSKFEDPFDIVTVELTCVGTSIFGSFEDHRRYFKTKCPTCGRAMVAGYDECCYCERHSKRRKSANRSRRYRQRHGLVKHLPIQQCAQCRWLFEPKRSTARFCSTTCRVKAHRLTAQSALRK